MDLEDLTPGQNFAKTIDEAIASCQAVLVVIGPRWMDILRKRSHENQQDYVRHELESALAQHITIIPVLVGGATMEQLADLPKNLQEVRMFQAAELRDSSFNEDCTRLANALGIRRKPETTPAERKKLFLWIAATAALIGLLVAISTIAGISPWGVNSARKATIRRLLATAHTQTDQAEYQSAFKTYHEALTADPANSAVMDLQVDAAMLWLQDFHVIAGEGKKPEDIAGPPLAEIISVLDAGLARTNGRGSRAADILAHLGWAHWLNQKIAYKEFGPAAERGLRRALSVDPSNVFANAMLGNWLLQTHGSVEEALRHFDVAVKTKKQRPLVRQMQLGAMVYNEVPGIRSELIKVSNQMRINGEPVGDRYKSRILSAYAPGTNSYEELRETLSAVPPNDAWATFLWLDDKPATGSAAEDQRIRHEFIHASIVEIEGKPADALAMFRGLEPELKARGYNGRIASHVSGAIKRLSQ